MLRRYFCSRAKSMKVLIAVDSSNTAAKAFDWYITNLHKKDDEIYVYHEADQPDLPSLMFAGSRPFPEEEMNSILSEHKLQSDQLKDCYMKKCYGNKIKKFEVVVVTGTGKAGHGIVKKAESIGAGMIIMGTRGCGLVRRTVFGSVSDYVLHHSKIPVLICRKQ